MNWNKEHIQLRVRGGLMGRYCKVLFDDIEVGRILANLPKNTSATSRGSYTISAAEYGTYFSIHPCLPAVVDRSHTVDIVLMVVICLCLNDRSYED